jgi:proteasome accessory factor A
MLRILSGTETEYGLLVEGNGAEHQVDDAAAFVRGYPGACHAGWDYRYESPRADLRGFSVSKLAVDPVDAQFDRRSKSEIDGDIRSDRILPNGARFYNDHGHPEYSTPECWSSQELALQDCAGELVLLDTARAYAERYGRKVSIYKNNTDFHGASYGSHESYLVPRSMGFESLYQAVLPMLVARQVLCGAGKVGAESGRSCAYQISQRADFFVEPYNTETLFRRPIFNTRDEPHADPAKWIRLHVICGDANRIASATARRVGLVKLALAVGIAGEAPVWKFKRPVEAFQNISRDETYRFEVELEGGSWTTAHEILESYFSAAEAIFGLAPSAMGDSPESEAHSLIAESRELLVDLTECPERFARKVDWAAKRQMIEHFMEHEGSDWNDPKFSAFDLEYHNIDPEEGLFHALVDMGTVESQPSEQTVRGRLERNVEGTRARARGVAVSRFEPELAAACWRSLVFKTENSNQEVLLDPDVEYPPQLEEATDVGTFIQWIQELKSSEQTND